MKLSQYKPSPSGKDRSILFNNFIQVKYLILLYRHQFHESHPILENISSLFFLYYGPINTHTSVTENLSIK